MSYDNDTTLAINWVYGCMAAMNLPLTDLGWYLLSMYSIGMASAAVTVSFELGNVQHHTAIWHIHHVHIRRCH